MAAVTPMTRRLSEDEIDALVERWLSEPRLWAEAFGSHPTRATLTRYVEMDVDFNTFEAVSDHITRCAFCRGEVDRLDAEWAEPAPLVASPMSPRIVDVLWSMSHRDQPAARRLIEWTAEVIVQATPEPATRPGHAISPTFVCRVLRYVLDTASGGAAGGDALDPLLPLVRRAIARFSASERRGVASVGPIDGTPRGDVSDDVVEVSDG